MDTLNESGEGSIKIKNSLKGLSFFADLDFFLRTISVNGDKRGCSGFIQNIVNGKIAYISTEHSYVSGKSGKFLIRSAKSLKDYTGGQNMFTTLEQLPKYITDLLSDKGKGSSLDFDGAFGQVYREAEEKLKPQRVQKSFYGKAHVNSNDEADEGKSIVLKSYSTNVAEIKGDKLYVYGWYSSTTCRHINEFASQNGFSTFSKRDIDGKTTVWNHSGEEVSDN